MSMQSVKPFLSAVFVDFDNIYLSLQRKNKEAAKRFSKDAGSWIKEIETGRLITPSSAAFDTTIQRRIVMNRCYGNPNPRRTSPNNATDMNSFPFVRHHFLRSGFEIVDCPPLTQQMKNSADIRMVMDARDFLNHDTYFDEFVIMSADADFTPLLHRLRAHARRTVIFANDRVAAPYTSICDGQIREDDLITLLLEGRLPGEADVVIETDSVRDEQVRGEIITEVVEGVRAAAAPVPLEALADRALRNLGHDKTAGTSWAGTGSFRELLKQALPADIVLSEQPPYYAYDTKRHQMDQVAAVEVNTKTDGLASQPAPIEEQPAGATIEAPASAPVAAVAQPNGAEMNPRGGQTAEQSYAAAAAGAPTSPPVAVAQAATTKAAPPQVAPLQMAAAPVQSAPAPVAGGMSTGPEQAPRSISKASAIQQSIARIHDACQAPVLAPMEYRVLFDVMACELNENGLTGVQTLTNIEVRAQAKGIEVTRDDIRFVLDVVSEADPWFEQGASVNLFAGRFRNFVVARCRGQGLNLSADELDLIEALFAGSDQAAIAGAGSSPGLATTQATASQQMAVAQAVMPNGLGANAADQQMVEEDFPRIIRSQSRG